MRTSGRRFANSRSRSCELKARVPRAACAVTYCVMRQASGRANESIDTVAVRAVTFDRGDRNITAAAASAAPLIACPHVTFYVPLCAGYVRVTRESRGSLRRNGAGAPFAGV
jgi:hypothetical protein